MNATTPTPACLRWQASLYLNEIIRLTDVPQRRRTQPGEYGQDLRTRIPVDGLLSWRFFPLMSHATENRIGPTDVDSPTLIPGLRERDNASWALAYGPLFHTIQRILYHQVRADLGADLENEACHIITDEIMRGLEAGKWPDLRSFSELSALASRMANLRGIDLVRRLGRKRESALPEGWEDILGSVLDGGQEGEEVFEQTIRQLDPPPKRPELFRDYFVKGATYQEIADAHEMTVGVVCSHFFRGLAKLRQLMEGGKLK